MRKLMRLQWCVLCTLISIVPATASDTPPQAIAKPDSDSVRSMQLLLPFKSGEAFGFIDRSGQVVIQPQFDDAYPFADDLSLVTDPPIRGPLAKVINFNDGVPRFEVIDHLGQKKFILENVPLLRSTGMSCDERPFGVFSEGLLPVAVVHPGQSTNKGYVNEAGALVFEGSYDSVEDFSEGLAVVSEFNLHGSYAGFVDRTGKVAIPLQFVNARSFSEGLAAVQDQASKLWGYIDRHGVYALPPKFKGAWSFSEGHAVVGVDGGRILIDRHGTPEGPLAPSVGRFSMGLAPFNFQGHSDGNDPYSQADQYPDAAAGGQWGYRDAAGKVVIAPQFAYARPFEGGLAAVNIGGHNLTSVVPEGNVEGGKWGYIDKSGKIVIEPKFRDAASFRHGLAAVEKFDGTCAYIDYTGKELAIVGLHDFQGAGNPEASLPGVRGPNLIKSLYLDQLAPSDSMAIDITKGLVSTRRYKTRSYDLDHQDGLGADLKSMVTSAPRPTSPGSRPHSLPPEMRAQRGMLLQRLSKCEDDGGIDGPDQCELRVKASDYENLLNDPYTTAVSKELQNAVVSLNRTVQRRLEARLSGMMERLRQRLGKSSDHGLKRGLQRVAVKISGSNDTNVVAEFRHPTLVLSTGLKRPGFPGGSYL